MTKPRHNLRHQGIDLARIVLMVMVIAFHTVSFGNLNYHHPLTRGAPNFLQSHLLASFTVVAVNCYVMISGYVRIRACPGKLTLLLIPVCFYNVLIGTWFSYQDGGVSPFEILIRFANSFTETYWFVETYVVLFLISPYLNKLLDEITMGRHLLLILVGGLLFYLLPMSTLFDLTSGDRGFGIENFIMLYVTGDYIRRRFPNGFECHTTRLPLLAFALYLGFSLITYVINAAWAAYRHPEDGIQAPFYGYNILPIYFGAACLLMFFLGLNINCAGIQRAIRTTAPLAFPVYIIHEQPEIRLRVYDWFSWYEGSDSCWLLFVPLSALLIFLSFAAVEWLRKIVFGCFDDLLACIATSLAGKAAEFMSRFGDALKQPSLPR